MALGELEMRKVTPADVPQIVEFLKANFHETQGLIPLGNRNKFVMSDEHITAWAQKAANHPDLIAFIDDDGMILGEFAETVFGPNRIARGGVWYVRPRARGGPLAWRLLKAFDQQAAEKGALAGRMELDNPSYIDVIDRMYKKIGFREFSKIYVKEY